MAVVSLPSSAGGVEEIQAGLDHVLGSERFRKTPSLRLFLKYLVDKTLIGETAQIKESIIAIDVFGRRGDFDGRLDNIVRVQAHRLRKLLETYYQEEGSADRIRFSVPKGSYIPRIDCMDSADGLMPVPAVVTIEAPAVAEEEFEEHPAAPVRVAEPAPNRGVWRTAVILLAGMVLGALLVSLPRVRKMWTDSAGAASAGSSGVDPAVAAVWGGLFEPGVKTITAYTNPAFLRLGHSRMFLQYRGPVTAPPGTEIKLAESDPADRQFLPKGQPLIYGDGWTGTGEVLAVNRLTLVASQMKGALTLVASRVLSVRDVHGSNVIFLGSPWGNGDLANLGWSSAPIRSRDKGRIELRDPGPGEAPFYSNTTDATTGEIKEVYALFSVLPGMDSGRLTASSAGLGTAATWAGIDFATSPGGAAQLVRALEAANGGKMPRYFQALIRADLIKSNAANIRLVTVRVVRPTDPS